MACLTSLRQLEQLHEVLNGSLDPRPGFADRVLDTLAPTGTSHHRTDDSGGLLLTVGIFLVATITTLLTLSLADVASPGAGSIRPELFAISGLVGLAALKVTPRVS